MPLRLESKCHICKAIRKNKKLAHRLYESKYYVKGGEPVWQIAEEYGLAYRPMLNHCKYHQTLDPDQLITASINRAAKKQVSETVRQQVRTMDARQELIDRGYEKLMSGEWDSELDMKNWLTALAQADNRELKMGDQGIDFMRLMATMRSGELAAGIQKPLEVEAGEFDPWKEKTSEM